MTFSMEKANITDSEEESEEQELLKPPKETIDDLRSMKEFAQSRKESSERLFEMKQKEIERLREEIEGKKEGIIQRIFEFKKIREMERQLGFQREVGERHEKDASEIQKLIGQYDGLIAEREHYDALVEEAYAENDAFDERGKEAVLEEERKRDIANLAKEHGVFFAHDYVVGDGMPSANNKAINTRGMDLLDLLDTDLALAPPIAVSSLHPGTREGLFHDGSGKRSGGFGCFVSAGRVTAAGRGDIGSVAISRYERVVFGEELKKADNIDEAIKKDDFDGKSGYEESTSYNELVVQNPEIAGVYIRWEEGDGNQSALADNAEITLQNGNGRGYDEWWETIGGLKMRNIPFFILDRSNNTTRLAHDIDMEKRTFKVTPVFTPEMMVSMPGIYKQHTDKEERRKAVMRIFDKVSGVLTEEEKTFEPDGSERDMTTSPYRLYE